MVWSLRTSSILLRLLLRLDVKPSTWLLAYLQTKTFFSVSSALLLLRVILIRSCCVRHRWDRWLRLRCALVFFVKVILFQFSEFANVDVFVLWPLGRLFRHKRWVLCLCTVNSLVEQTPQSCRLFLLSSKHTYIRSIEIFRNHTRILTTFLLLLKQQGWLLIRRYYGFPVDITRCSKSAIWGWARILLGYSPIVSARFLRLFHLSAWPIHVCWHRFRRIKLTFLNRTEIRWESFICLNKKVD